MVLRRLVIAGIIVALGFGFIIFFLGIRNIYVQLYHITHFKPVEAKILASSVKVSRGADVGPGGYKDYHEPDITYEYTVGGKKYKSDTVVIPCFGSIEGEEWAKEVVNAYKKGTKATAYYNPENPSDSFLLKKCFFIEHYGNLVIAAPCYIIAFLLWMYFFGYAFNFYKEPEQTQDERWYEMIADMRNTDKLRMAVSALIIWLSFSIPAFGLYFWVAKPPYTSFAITTLKISSFLTLIPVAFITKYIFLYLLVGEGKIFVDRNQFQLGDAFNIRYKQRFRNRHLADRLKLVFICEKYTVIKRKNKKWYQKIEYKKTEQLYKHEIPTSLNPNIISDSAIEIEDTCHIPDNLSVSTEPGKIMTEVVDNQKPLLIWGFRATAPIYRFLNYKAEFVILVKPKEIDTFS